MTTILKKLPKSWPGGVLPPLPAVFLALTICLMGATSTAAFTMETGRIPEAAGLRAELAQAVTAVRPLSGEVRFPVLPEEFDPAALPAPEMPVDFYESQSKVLLLRYLTAETDRDTYRKQLDELTAEYHRQQALIFEWLENTLRNVFPVDQERRHFIMTHYPGNDSQWLFPAELMENTAERQAAYLAALRQQLARKITAAPPPPVQPSGPWEWKKPAEDVLRDFQRTVPERRYVDAALLTALDRTLLANTSRLFQKIDCRRRHDLQFSDQATVQAAGLAYDFRAVLDLPLTVGGQEALYAFLGLETPEGAGACEKNALQYDFFIDKDVLAGRGHANGATYLHLLLSFHDYLQKRKTSGPGFYQLPEQEGLNTLQDFADRELTRYRRTILETVEDYGTALLSLPEEQLDPAVRLSLEVEILPQLSMHESNMEGK